MVAEREKGKQSPLPYLDVLSSEAFSHRDCCDLINRIFVRKANGCCPGNDCRNRFYMKWRNSCRKRDT